MNPARRGGKKLLIELVLFQVDLRLKEEEGGDISSFIPNGEWDLIGGGDIVQTELEIIDFQVKPANGGGNCS